MSAIGSVAVCPLLDLFAVGRLLGHVDHASTIRYSHLANDTLLAAVEARAKKQQSWPRCVVKLSPSGSR